jgi:hypothetical protein
MVTSTLSFNLIPQDKRQIERVNFSKFNEEDIRKYVDQKKAFLALVKSMDYRRMKEPEKRQDQNGAFLKSSFASAHFHTNTMAMFKEQVSKLNSNKKEKQKKSKETLKNEKSKHE